MSNIKCPKCGNVNPPDSVFCEECGQKLTKNEDFSTDFTEAPSAGNTAVSRGNMICPKCGASFGSDSVFCENCGLRLISEQPSAPAPVPPPVKAPAFAPPPVSAGGAPAPANGLKINMGRSSSGGTAGQNDNFKPLNSFDD